MNKLLTLLMFLCTLVVFSQEDEYSYANYHPNGNIKTYLNHKHGVYVEFFDNSQRKVAGRCEGGIVANLDKKLGEWVYFNKQGDLMKVYNYQCDKLNSKLIFDDSCRVKSGKWIEDFFDKKTIRNKGYLKNYNKEGKWEKYYNDGVLRQVINYKNDVRQGECIYYYDNGNLSYKTNYKNGKESGAYKFYDKDTKKLIIETTMLNGKFNGSFQENYVSGTIYKKGNFNKGDKIGNWYYYFENGTLKMEGIYENNERTGLWKRYNETGVLIAEIQFKNGERDGKSILYNEDGTIRETKSYTKGNVTE